ncbi:hypothetical protein M9Y10_011802 [Tritrichomonas musculus]|uniref:DUF3447 domain-containing protein n=1 Tax=Tritrichomonas musculus TaxID=1915356 RepID=A0ABR2IKF0_9EUKA
MKNNYKIILEFFESKPGAEISKVQKKVLNQVNKSNERDEIREIMQIISLISDNHHRGLDLISRTEQIISYINEKIKKNFTNQEIFEIFKKNKRILYYLFKIKTIIPDDYILHYIYKRSGKYFINLDGEEEEEYEEEEERPDKLKIENNCRFNYDIYFYPQIKNFITKEKKRQIENKISKLYPNALNDFEKKQENGENPNILCEMIRSDSIENFVAYVNENSISLKATIKQSVFETNSFLIMNNKQSLIEYAAFYGSIQIFQFLLFNKVELKPSLWLYSIHGKNAELIHLLEENQVPPPDNSFKICLKKAIKCHHNDISNYIKSNLIKDDDDLFDSEYYFKENIASYSFHYHNYCFYQNKLDDYHTFLYLCQYNYVYLVKFYLNHKNIDVNKKLIYTICFYEI